MPSSIPDPPDSRAAILLAVWQVIASRGIDAVSFRSVAAAADISPGRVQHYFPTRVELIRASAQHMVKVASDTFPARDPWTVLTHPFAGADAKRSGTGVYYAFVAVSAIDTEIRATLREARAEVLTFLAQECGEDLSNLLLATSEGLTLHIHLGILTPAAAEEHMRTVLEEHRPG